MWTPLPSAGEKNPAGGNNVRGQGRIRAVPGNIGVRMSGSVFKRLVDGASMILLEDISGDVGRAQLL
eukprot:1192116-Pyramimonas_sp.AAC.1